MQTSAPNPPTRNKRSDILFFGALALLAVIVLAIAAYFLFLQPQPPSTIPYPVGYIVQNTAKVKVSNDKEQQALDLARKQFGNTVTFVKLSNDPSPGSLEIWYDSAYSGAEDKPLLMRLAKDYASFTTTVFNTMPSVNRVRVSAYAMFKSGTDNALECSMVRAYNRNWGGAKLVDLSLATEDDLPAKPLIKAWSELIFDDKSML